MVNPKYFTLHSGLRNSDQFLLREFFYLLKMNGLKLTVKNLNQRDFQCTSILLGSLSKHDGDGSENVIWKCNFAFLQNTTTTATKTLQICLFDNEKQYFCTLCTCIFHLLTFWRRSRSFYDVKWPVLQLCGRRQHMMTKFNFVFLCPKRLFQFNSRTVRTHFSSITTLNN